MKIKHRNARDNSVLIWDGVNVQVDKDGVATVPDHYRELIEKAESVFPGRLFILEGDAVVPEVYVEVPTLQETVAVPLDVPGTSIEVEEEIEIESEDSIEEEQQKKGKRR